MKLPRLATRRAMALVNLAASPLALVAWMERRAVHFRAEASRHLARSQVEDEQAGVPWTPRSEHHRVLSRKYEEAARAPWRQIAPDPPEPEAAP